MFAIYLDRHGSWKALKQHSTVLSSYLSPSSFLQPDASNQVTTSTKNAVPFYICLKWSSIQNIPNKTRVWWVGNKTDSLDLVSHCFTWTFDALSLKSVNCNPPFPYLFACMFSLQVFNVHIDCQDIHYGLESTCRALWAWTHHICKVCNESPPTLASLSIHILYKLIQ